MTRQKSGSSGTRSGTRGLRPTSGLVKNALFSMLGPDGVDGRRVLDLYAGAGGLGLEALRRGASSAEFVEINERRCRAIRSAASREGFAGRTRVYQGRVERVVKRLEGGYEVVFIDPPYADDPFAQVLGALGGRGVLAPGAVVFAEHDRRRELDDSYPGLQRESTRRYGDTAVSIYRPDTRSESSSASGVEGW